MLTFTLVTLLLSQQADPVMLKPEIAWAGVLPKDSLRAAAPATGVITDPADFAALWEAWRPGDKQPELDFANTIIVVGTIDGPNRMFVGLSNDAGNLKTQFGGTKVGGPGFGYIIAAVKRDGFDRVNGRPLPKPQTHPLEAPATEPEPPTEPPAESPSSQRPPRQARPAPPRAESADRPTPRGKDSIRVSVRGELETGLLAIGGETTGTVIRSKGLMFEVAFTRPGLQERAEALNGQMALVAGELAIKEGIETGTRLIIEADRVDLVRASKR